MATATQPGKLPANFFEVDLQEEGHVCTRRKDGIRVPTVTQVIESVGLFKMDEMLRYVMARKSRIGLEVHSTTAIYDQGENIFEDYELDPRVSGYCESYAKLKKALDFRPYLIEFGHHGATVNGMEVGFRIDRIGALAGQETVVELKCTAEEEAHHGVQLAGYDTCMGGQRRGRVVFQLFPDGRMGKCHTYEDHQDYEAFLYALWLTWWKKNHRKDFV